MSPVPDFILEIREMVGTHPLWLPGVTAVVVRGDELLMVERADNGAWTPVTGIVDPGEEPAVAAAREALEETGVVISVDRLAAVSVQPEVTYGNGDRASYLDLTFACTWVSGQAHVADDESTDVRWWPLAALPPMPGAMRARVEAALAHEREARFVSGGAPRPHAPEPLRPEAPVLGVVACAAGRVGVLLGPDGRATVHVARTVPELVDLVRESSPVALVVEGPLGEGPAGPPPSREELAAEGITAPAWFRGSGFTEGELLGACAVLGGAARRLRA